MNELLAKALDSNRPVKNTPRVHFQRTGYHDLPLPAYATAGASGMDLRACLYQQSGFFIHPGQRATISTGFNIELPKGFEGQVRPRSGLAAKHGVTVLNTPGTIDEDYRGEIAVILINHSRNSIFEVKHGDRIAQLVIAPVYRFPIEEVSELGETVRGQGGFGSTGVG
jgi:dUTP pyrophosphatase